jgi:soluble lytic murein transglycosylase
VNPKSLAFTLGIALFALCSESIAARTLDLRSLSPYLEHGGGRRARTALRAGSYDEAERLLRRYASRSRHQRRQALFLLAYAQLKQGKWQAAARRFRALERSYPLMRDYARFYAAVALYRHGQFAAALRQGKLVSADSGVDLDARLLRAEALHALGQIERSAHIWRQYLEKNPRGARRAEARYYLALGLLKRAERQGDQEALELRRDAIAQLKALLVEAPLSSWRDKAESRLEQLAAIVPDGKALSSLNATEIYEQSLVLYRNMRNKAAEAGFERAMSAGLPLALQCRACYHRGHSVYRQRQQRRAADLFSTCIAPCKQAGETLMTVKCLFNRARGLRMKRAYTKAIETFDQIEREFPEHSYADDARLLSAEILAQMDEKRQVEQRLSTLPKDYPGGDMSREALWRLARQAYFDGHFGRALERIERLLELGPASQYFAAGRAQYWKARILHRQGRRDSARKSYEKTVRDYPLSYYALLSLNRLREGFRSAYRRLVRDLIAPVGRHPGRWRIPRDKSTRSSAFRRGVELARLGFAASAARELKRAGFSVKRASSTERLWLAAALYDQAQLWNLSHSVPRYRDRRYRKTYPLKDNYRHWRLAYPFAYAPFVRRHSSRARISPYLTLAVMREESAFNAAIESYANAIGLMQLILPTARAAGAFHNMRVGRATLRNPDSNIRLGTTYLAFLRKSFGNVTPLAIAGYNAGHGAVFRWLKQFRGNSLDEIVEQIPYDQTRHYTKRVLSSLFAYHMLYESRPDKRVPRIGQAVPRLTRRPEFVAKTKRRKRRPGGRRR